SLSSRRKGGATRTPRTCRLSGEDTVPDLRLDEDPEQLGVTLPALDLVGDDVERLVDGHRLLVRAVAGGQRVEDVADGHHARLDPNLLGLEPARIAGAIELLVVRARDLRNRAQAPPPRNGLEEVVGVDDVALDLAAL